MKKFTIKKTVEKRVAELQEYLSHLNYSIGMTKDTVILTQRKAKRERVLNKLSLYKNRHPEDFILKEIHLEGCEVGYRIRPYKQEDLGEGDYYRERYNRHIDSEVKSTITRGIAL